MSAKQDTVFVAVDDYNGKLLAYGTGVTPQLALADARVRCGDDVELSVVALTSDEWEEWLETNDA